MRIVRWILLVVALSSAQTYALIRTGMGNKPVSDPGWPAGSVTVANLPVRIGWWEGPPFGGGEWHFEFRGGTAAFQEALDAFGKISAPALELFIHDGTLHSFVLDPNHTNKTDNVDWTFVVWDPNRWEALYGKGQAIRFSDDPNAGKSRPAPLLDVYPGPGSRIAFEKVKVPATVSVHDERAATAGVDTSAGTVLVATITDAQTQQPLPGARFVVTARDAKGQYSSPLTNAVADANGVARIDGLPAGVFQLSAAAEGYAETAVAYGDYPEHAYKKFTASLARAGALSGRVTDANGAPVPNIRVIAANTLLASNVPYRTLSKTETMSDNEGRFTLSNLPIGLVQVWIQSAAWFQTNSFDYHSVPGSDASIVISPTGSLLIHVRDATGRGIGEWQRRQLQVSVESSKGSVRGSWGGSATLKPDGTYFFTGVHPGAYSIKLLNTPKQAVATVLPNQLAEVTMQLP
jgi:protocatechuate 3,4-dioxygenase beta subunit